MSGTQRPAGASPAGGVLPGASPQLAPSSQPAAGPLPAQNAASSAPLQVAAGNVASGDRQRIAAEERIRELQIKIALQSLEVAYATNEATLEEARARAAKSKREREQAEIVARPREALLPDVSRLPPPNLANANIASPGNPPQSPVGPGSGPAAAANAAPQLPRATLQSSRRGPAGNIEAVLIFENNRYEVTVGSPLPDNWFVAAIDLGSARIERHRPATRNERAPAVEAVIARFNPAAAAVSPPPPLPPLPLRTNNPPVRLDQGGEAALVNGIIR